MIFVGLATSVFTSLQSLRRGLVRYAGIILPVAPVKQSGDARVRKSGTRMMARAGGVSNIIPIDLYILIFECGLCRHDHTRAG